jgi:3-methyladenine DNA glycosylase AlkD
VYRPVEVARDAQRELARHARPAGEFDASRYFRGAHDLGFYNVGTPVLRAMARRIAREHTGVWEVGEAMSFAEALVGNRYIDAKSLGIEVLACYRRAFTPALLPAWKRWLAEGYAANWATTDAICGLLIGPLLVEHPALASHMRAWSHHRVPWVRRAAAVSLIPSVRRGGQLDLAYQVARSLHPDREDLIHKAVGWLLRESGKADQARLERYLRAHGPSIPRTTVRYAIERFPPTKRKALLRETKKS